MEIPFDRQQAPKSSLVPHAGCEQLGPVGVLQAQACSNLATLPRYSRVDRSRKREDGVVVTGHARGLSAVLTILLFDPIF